MKAEWNQLLEDVADEIKSIDESIRKLKIVHGDFQEGNNKLSAEPAMGTYLMNFYNGIENILKRISKEYYKTMTRGESWHKELLLLSGNPPNGKRYVFLSQTIKKLQPYLAFRHRFISGYGFQLKEERMKELIDNIENTWQDVKKSLSEFWPAI